MSKLNVRVLLLTFSVFVSSLMTAQVIGPIITVGSSFALMGARRENLVKKLETQAVEWMLKEHPEIPSFSLDLVSLHRPGLDNWRNSTDCTFLVTAAGKGNMVLVWAAGHGAWSVNGVDYSKGQFELFDKDAWLKVLRAYAQISLPNSLNNIDSIPVYTKYMDSKKAEENWKSQVARNPKLAGSSFDHIVSSTFSGESKVLTYVAGMNQLYYATDSYYIFREVTNYAVTGEYTLNLTSLAGDWYGYKDLGNVQVVQNGGHLNLFLKESGRLVHIRSHHLLELNSAMLGFVMR